MQYLADLMQLDLVAGCTRYCSGAAGVQVDPVKDLAGS